MKKVNGYLSDNGKFFNEKFEAQEEDILTKLKISLEPILTENECMKAFQFMLRDNIIQVPKPDSPQQADFEEVNNRIVDILIEHQCSYKTESMVSKLQELFKRNYITVELQGTKKENIDVIIGLVKYRISTHISEPIFNDDDYNEIAHIILTIEKEELGNFLDDYLIKKLQSHMCHIIKTSLIDYFYPETSKE